jgi:hypothetical protein
MCGLGAGCTYNYHRSEKEAALRKLASETPPYPGFQLTGTRIVFKSSMIYLFFDYRSEASLREVKAYYNQLLAKNGWSPPEVQGPSLFVSTEGDSRYRRGEYVIVVSPVDSSTTTYQIVYEWRQKG